MANSLEKSSEKPINLRYKELREIESKTKDKIRKLKELQSNISQDRYQAILSEHEEVLKQVEPQVAELRIELEKIKEEKAIEFDAIKKQMDANDKKINEANKLRDADIISRSQHDEDTAPLIQDNKRLEATLNEKKKELSIITGALEGVVVVAPPPVIAESQPEEQDVFDFAPTPAPVAKINYYVRFSSFFVLAQLLCFALWFLINTMVWMNQPKIIPILHSLFVIALVFTTIFYLFQGTRARTVAYFITGGIFLAVSVLIATSFGTNNFMAEGLWPKIIAATCFWPAGAADNLNFLTFWAAWNLIATVLVFVITVLRAFFVGLKYEYSRTE
jgi:hypothetical protein